MSVAHHMADGPPSARSSLRAAGSGRRVNFGSSSSDGHLMGGSQRRDSNAERSASYHHLAGSGFGSSSRKMQVHSGSPLIGRGEGGVGIGVPLSPEQQSATQSAVSMNSIFSEARRVLRRDVARESAIRSKEEYQRASEEAGTPAGTPRKDIEAGANYEPAGMGGSGGTPQELSWQSDLHALREMLQSNYILAALLACIPLGILAHFTRIGGVSSIFILNFLAIIPLAWLLGNATEELALRSNQTIGGLLNATFGNAVELIVSVVALRKGMIKLVQVRSVQIPPLLSLPLQRLLLITPLVRFLFVSVCVFSFSLFCRRVYWVRF